MLRDVLLRTIGRRLNNRSGVKVVFEGELSEQEGALRYAEEWKLCEVTALRVKVKRFLEWEEFHIEVVGDRLEICRVGKLERPLGHKVMSEGEVELCDPNWWVKLRGVLNLSRFYVVWPVEVALGVFACSLVLLCLLRGLVKLAAYLG